MVARTRLARCPNSQSSAAQDVRSLIAMSAIPVQKEGSLKSSWATPALWVEDLNLFLTDTMNEA
jgi:hypothetical protein